MEIAKCSFCSKEVGEVGKNYYEAREKKKDDFGMGEKEKIFCQNCWKEQEKNYRNYPCDTEEAKRHIVKQEIEKKTSIGYHISGDWVCYDPVKKEWVKEREETPIKPENKPVGPVRKENDNGWIIWVIVLVILIVSLLFLGHWWHRRKKSKSRKRLK